MVKAAIASRGGVQEPRRRRHREARKTFRESKGGLQGPSRTPWHGSLRRGTPLEKFTEGLDGPNAIILGYDDVVVPAKVLRDVLREQGEKMTVKAGVVQGTWSTPRAWRRSRTCQACPSSADAGGNDRRSRNEAGAPAEHAGRSDRPGAQGEVGEGGLAAVRPRKRTLFNFYCAANGAPLKGRNFHG